MGTLCANPWQRLQRPAARMFVTTKWEVLLRFIASVLLFESALSFRQPPVLQHHVLPKKNDGLYPSSSRLASRSSSCIRDQGVCQRSGSTNSLWPSGIYTAVAVHGYRQRQRERLSAEQPPLVVMLAAAGGTGGGGEADSSGAVDVAPAGGPPSSKSEQQQVNIASQQHHIYMLQLQ